MHKIPCHVIAGPLGVGKTTAILNFLKQQPTGSRIGVLVNDFGPVGLDQAKLDAEAPTAQVVNLQGGCICCTLLASLPEAVCKLTDNNEIDRLIIEPSGMASPAQVINALIQPEMQDRIQMQPTCVMLSAVDFDEQTFEQMPYYRMLCEVGDVLIFNRCDQVSKAKLARVRAWAKALAPSKLRMMTTSASTLLPMDLLTGPPSDAPNAKELPADAHVHQFDSTAKAGGVALAPGEAFDEQRLLANLQHLCEQGVNGNEILRLKGVFQTGLSWQAFDIANGRVSHGPSAYRGETRIEWVTRPAKIESEQMLATLQRSAG